MVGPGEGAATQAASDADKAKLSEEAKTMDASTWVAFARVVGNTAKPGLVVGDANAKDSLIAKIRAESVPVTTVDSVATSIGHANAAIALLSADHSARSFGLASTATNLVPPLPGVDGEATR